MQNASDLSPELPASAQRVAGILAGLGHDGAVTLLTDSARTAAEAAAALGCSVAEIAKSIVFRSADTDAAVVVITSGDQRVDGVKVAALVGEIGKADADFVRAATGYAIGGVSPVGHPPSNVVLVDRSLFRFDRIWAAAGHPHAVFPLAPADLTAWLDVEPVDVSVD